MNRQEINDMVERLIAHGLDPETIAYLVRVAIDELPLYDLPVTWQ